MLSINIMSSGRADYYADLAKDGEYYTKGGEPPGVWRGGGAKELGLSGEIDNDQFKEVFSGMLDGRSLVQNAGSEKRRPGWDLTFSAPKSVSVAWSQADRDTGALIQKLHDRAVNRALEYVEEHCGWTRRGKAGKHQEQAKCVFATFEHGTSRAQDPQLHTHALFLNVCVRGDGTTGALETPMLYANKMTAGAIYRAELSHLLHQELGLVIERKDKQFFEIAGVPESLMEEFSKRRRAIIKELTKQGLTSAKASEAAALATRENKEHTPREELFREWKKTGRSHGWTTSDFEQLIDRAKKIEPGEQQEIADRAVERALTRVTEQNSTFRELDFIRYAAEELQGEGIAADWAINTSKAEINRSTEICHLGSLKNFDRYTTQEILDIEKKLIQTVKATASVPGMGIQEEVVVRVLNNREKDGLPLSADQEVALRNVTQGTGSFAAVVGDAGTGKTTLLESIREAAEMEGWKIRGAALSGRASTGIREGSGIESQTLHSLLAEIELGKSPFDEEKAEAAFEAWVEEKIKTGETDPEAPPRFDPASARKRYSEAVTNLPDAKTLLVIDEAGMVDTRQMGKLIDEAHSLGARVLFLGDNKQLQPVGIGGSFQGILGVLDSSRLTTIFRQRNEGDRIAVSNLAAGDAAAALNYFASEGNLSVSESRDDALAALVRDWYKEGARAPEGNLMIAGRNADARTLNEIAHEMRYEEGLLGSSKIEHDGIALRENDRVLFTKNHSRLGVENGRVGTVTSVSESLSSITVVLDGVGNEDARTRTFTLKQYPHLQLGYAVTTHKAQGVTTENAYVLTDEAMQDKEFSYVQASRARERTRFYTTEDEAGEELSELSKRMATSREKELALEVERKAREQALAR